MNHQALYPATLRTADLQVDAGIQTYIAYPGIHGHVRAPLRRVIAQKVVHRSRQTSKWLQDGMGIGVGEGEFERHGGLLWRALYLDRGMQSHPEGILGEVDHAVSAGQVVTHRFLRYLAATFNEWQRGCTAGGDREHVRGVTLP